MAKSFTISVPDDKESRILTAFGHRDTLNMLNPDWIPATPAEVRAAIKAWVQAKVNDYEKAATMAAQDTKAATETW